MSSSSSSSLLERMRKKLEANQAKLAKTATDASPRATKPSAGDAPSSLLSNTAPSAATSAAEASKVPPAVGTNAQSLKDPPPSFAAPPGSRLLYRDYKADPFCAPFTSLSAAKLFDRLLSDHAVCTNDFSENRKRRREGREEEEEEDGNDGEKVDTVGAEENSTSDACGERRVNPHLQRAQGEGQNASSWFNASNQAITYFEKEFMTRRGWKAIATTDSSSNVSTYSSGGSSGASPSPDTFLSSPKGGRDTVASAEATANKSTSADTRSLYTDSAYALACAEAHLEVTGSLRSACRSVQEEYALTSRISEGVYGVVWKAFKRIHTKGEEEAEEHANTTNGVVSAHVDSRAHKDGRVVALKSTKREWLEESEVGFPPYLLREFDLLLRIKHPNIAGVSEVLNESAEKREKDSDGKASGASAEAPLPPPPTLAPLSEKNEAQEGTTSTYHLSAEELAIAAATAAAQARRRRVTELRSNRTVRSVYLAMDYCSFDLTTYMFRLSRDPSRAPYFHISSRNTHPQARNAFLSRVKCVMVQLLRAVAFLHSHRILHRDVKTSNVLLDGKGVVKLCDFGLSRHYREGEALTPTVVTLMYRAPELHFGISDYSHTVDVWSVACIFAELFLKEPLFKASSDSQHLLAMCDILSIPTEENFPGVYRLPLARELLRAMPRWNRASKLAEVFSKSTCTDAHVLPESGFELLNSMLQWCPARRPSAAEALQHRFFFEEPLPCTPAELMTPMPSDVLTKGTATAAGAASAAEVHVPSGSSHLSGKDHSKDVTATSSAHSQPLPSHADGTKVFAEEKSDTTKVAPPPPLASSSSSGNDDGDMQKDGSAEYMSPSFSQLKRDRAADGTGSLDAAEVMAAQRETDEAAQRAMHQARLREDDDEDEEDTVVSGN